MKITIIYYAKNPIIENTFHNFGKFIIFLIVLPFIISPKKIIKVELYV